MKQHKFAHEPEILKRVTVRLLGDEDRARFDALLEQKHYLCNARMVGRTLRYGAELDGEWVALACFSAAALHLKAREKRPATAVRAVTFITNMASRSSCT